MGSEIVERFARVARDRPDRLLLIGLSEDRSLTCADLWTEYEAVRGACLRAGLANESLLVSVAGNRTGFVSLLLACLDLGTSLMPVDRGTPMFEILELVDRWHASGLVLLHPPVLDRPHLTIPLPNGLYLVPFTSMRPAPELYAGAIVLKLTSGSTGLPKATRTAERHLLADTSHIVEAMDIGPEDAQLGVIPLSHAYGFGNLVLPALVQGTAVVLRDGLAPSHVASDARAHRVRIFPGVPFMFEHLVGHLPAEAWPPSLDLLVTAGARITIEIVRAFHARFGRKIHSFYGASETGGISFDDTETIGDRLTVGRPLRDVRITFRDVDPEEAPTDRRLDSGALAPRQDDRRGPPGSGRIHVASCAVSAGYAGITTREQDGFVDEGFLTGDLGSLDDRGHLVLTGRVSSFINVAGRKVQPEEVERVLRDMPDVTDVRVIGAPDLQRGEVLAACIVTSDTRLRALDVRRFCATRLAPHKVPRVYVFFDEMPRDARGKTSRRALEAAITRELGDQ
jgi:acyl-CoA synthetase (AMP-forming)/AMP-acid ligase II